MAGKPSGDRLLLKRGVHVVMLVALIGPTVSAWEQTAIQLPATSKTTPPRPSPRPTYAQDIAPLLDRTCVPCHRAGAVGPFSLATWGDARKRARQIAQVTQSRYMPPWLPADKASPFAGCRRLSDRDIALLQRWALADAPEGDPARRPRPPRLVSVWPLGPPDLIVRMPRPFLLAAEGNEVCPSFVLPLPTTEDRALRAIDIRPGNPRVVRAASLFIDTEGKARRLAAQSGGVGYFAFGAGLDPVACRLSDWTPGSGPRVLPSGTAALLPKGADLVLMLRCEPDGKASEEQTEIGLYFAPAAPHLTPFTLGLGATTMFLKANQTASVTDSCVLPVATRLLRVVPHADPTCARLTVTAELPDGTAQTLLFIPVWKPRWAEPYQWAVPVQLPAGTRVTFAAFYDNASAHPNNAGRAPMSSQPSLEFMDENSGTQVQLVADKLEDEPALRDALQARSGTLWVEKKGGTGHG